MWCARSPEPAEFESRANTGALGLEMHATNAFAFATLPGKAIYELPRHSGPAGQTRGLQAAFPCRAGAGHIRAPSSQQAPPPGRSSRRPPVRSSGRCSRHAWGSVASSVACAFGAFPLSVTKRGPLETPLRIGLLRPRFARERCSGFARSAPGWISPPVLAELGRIDPRHPGRAPAPKPEQ